MATQQAKFNLQIGTTADLKGINEVKAALKDLRGTALKADTLFGADANQITSYVKDINALENAMRSAFDPHINTLNLQQFNKTLAISGSSMTKVRDSLSSLGPQGERAFIALAQQATTMNNTIKASSGFMDKLSQQMLNTARYQIMNSIFREITGSISQAYGYVKNLDKSLNNIQIITGKSADNMREFAQNANKAAQELGNQTKSYTDASLIYYQQGLSDEEVAGRTETTMKMSNVLKESADDVSSYMTAIWNNFDDGSKSLEYFGDVITNLGAHTASSAAEIAEGLGKFAAIADTVGLSYEYSTAALATVVAETRQSADVVGTAFKTLFARIQDLELGDEGSVSLGKYAQALEKIGINILEANGNMKEMDAILDEMGAKWNTLSQAQQTALAQNVAGTRQYSQLVALMENWDKVKENVDLARESEGTLAVQQARYMESTEAHLERMTAAWENFFDSMLKNDDINDTADVITSIGNGLADFADATGGLIPLLGTLGSVGMQAFSKQIGVGLHNAITNLETFKNKAEIYQRNDTLIKSEFSGAAWGQIDNGQSQASMMTLDNIANSYEKISQFRDLMSEQDNKYVNSLINQESELGNQLLQIEKMYEAWQEANGKAEEFKTLLAKSSDELSEMSGMFSAAIPESAIGEFNRDRNFTDTSGTDMIRANNALKQVQLNLSSSLSKAFKNELQAVEGLNLSYDESNSTLQLNGALTEKQRASIQGLLARYSEEDAAIKKVLEGLISYKQEIGNIKSLEDSFANNKTIELQYQNAVKMVGALGQLASSISIVKNLGNIWTDDNLSTGEKMLQTTMNLTMVLPMLVNGINTLTKSYEALVAATTLANAAQASGLKKNEVNTILQTANAISKMNKNLDASTLAQITANAVKKKGIEITAEDTAVVLTNANAHGVLGAALKALASPIGLVTMAIAAASIGIAAYKKHLKDLAEEAKNIADANKQLVDSHNEQANSLKSLSQEYENLVKNQEGLSTEELNQQSYKLCLQYNQEELAVVALTKGYMGLKDAIADVESARNDKVIADSNKTLVSYTDAISKGIASAAGTRSAIGDGNGNKLLQLSGMGLRSAEQNEFAERLKQAGVNFFSNSEIELNSLVQALETNSSKINNILADYDFKAAKDLRKWVSAVATEVDSYNSVLSTFREAKGDNIISEMGDELKQISDLSEYLKQRDILTQEALNNHLYNSYEECEKWAQAQMGLIDGVSKYAAQAVGVDSIFKDLGLDRQELEEDKEIVEDIVEELKQPFIATQNNNILSSIATTETSSPFPQLTSSSNIGDSVIASTKVEEIKTLSETIEEETQSEKELAEQIESAYNDLSPAQKNFFSENHLLISRYLENHIKAGKTVDKVFTDITEKYKTLIEYNEKLANSKSNQAIADSLAEGNTLTKSDLHALEENGTFSDINKQAFRYANSNTQSLILRTDEYAKEDAIMADKTSRDKAVEALETEIEELKTVYDEMVGSDMDEFLAAYDDSIEKVYLDFARQGKNYTKESIQDALNTYQEALEQFDGDADKALASMDTGDIQIIEDYQAAYKDVDNTLAKNTKTAREYREEQSRLVKEQEKFSKGTIDYASRIKDLSKNFETSKKIVSEVKTAYKALSTAVKEYSAEGVISVDTLETLLQINPMYLSALDTEGGSLKLNKEMMAELTQARLLDELAAYKQTQMEILKSAATSKDAADMYALTAATNISTLTNDLFTASAVSQVEALIAAGKVLPEVAQEALNYAKNLDKAIEIAAKNIGNITPKNLDKAIGGGSKSGGSKKKDDKKYEDEFDKFHDLKMAIDDVSDAMSDMEKQQKHLYGKELAQSLRQENKLLEQQKQNYEQLLAAQKTELSSVANNLKAYGMEFDAATGRTLNYAEVTMRMFNEYEEKIKHLSGTALEAAEKEYNDFKKLLGQYDSLYKDVQTTQNNLDDIHYKQLENNLKAWEAEIQIKLDLEQAKQEWNQFLRNINTDFKLTYQKASQVMGGMKKEADSLVRSINIGINAMGDIEHEIDTIMGGGESSMFGSVSDAQNTLKKYLEQFETVAEALYQLYQDAWDEYLEGIDQIADQFQDIIDKFDRITDTLDHESKMIDLLYGQDSSRSKDYQRQVEEAKAYNLMTEMASYRDQVAFWADQYNQAVAFNGADSQDAYNIYQYWQDAIQNLYKTEEEYIEAIQARAIAMVDAVVAKWEEDITNGSSFEWWSEEWELAADAANRYYDSIERIYELQKLANKYQNAINEIGSNAKGQAKLQAIMEEQLNLLREKEDLTKTDVELAEKRLALAQAQIALEDAQNNKNAMKLTRDANGNWTYQYIANADEIAKKEEDVLKAQNDLYETAKKATDEATQDLLKLLQEYQSKVQEIGQKLATTTDENLKAQYQTQLDYYKGYYEDMLTRGLKEYDYLNEALDTESLSSIFNYGEMFGTEGMDPTQVQTYQDLVNAGVSTWSDFYAQYSNIQDLIKKKGEETNAATLETWNTTASEILRTWAGEAMGDEEENGEGEEGEQEEEEEGNDKKRKSFSSVLEGMQYVYDTITQAQEDYTVAVDEGCEAAGEDYTNVEDKIYDCIDATKSLEDATTEMIELACAELEIYREVLAYVEAAWYSVKDAVIAAGETAIEYLEKDIGVAEDFLAVLLEIIAKLNEISDMGVDVSGGGLSMDFSGTHQVVGGGYDSRIGLAYDIVKNSDGSLSNTNYRKPTERYTVASGNRVTKKLQFASGGYTGEWNNGSDIDNGRLAYLHQKELVLNEQDTKNILSAVDIMRNLSSNVESAIASRVASMAAGMMSTMGARGYSAGASNSEGQTFYIDTLSFPNANDVSTIQEAIMTLPNIVTQYVNQ